MAKEQKEKKTSRGAWTVSDLLQPVSWGDFFGILLWVIHIVGWVFILMFVLKVILFLVFPDGKVAWGRELIGLIMGVLFVVGTNYYVIRKKKHKKSYSKGA